MDRWLVNRQGREKLRRIVDRIEALANAGSAKPDGCRLRSGQIMNPRHPLLPVFVGQVYTRISQVSSIFSAARRRFCYKNHEVVAYMERRIWHTRWVHRNRGAFGSFLTVD